jgi:hypothetical protein
MVRLGRVRVEVGAAIKPCGACVAAARGRLLLIAAATLFFASMAPQSRAENARFDLIGPKIDVRVTRAGVTLPIAAVPNLQPGDRLWLHPDLPATQSVHYLMILAFLRGTTNPPPDSWFVRIETWDKKVRAEGAEVIVPAEAQQAVLFLAPVTGGDFSTLRSAVQGRPGIFVRASQDLAAAGFEQARIETYIDSMRQLTPDQTADPKRLQEHSNLIAATLALKPNAECAKLAPDQQYTCLTQAGNQTLLDDGHGQSIVDALTGGMGAGLINQASTTALAGGGVYSAYVGAIVDVVHIMGSLHTAQYQYIPAIASPVQQSLNLRLNTPPSFHNPKSVIVIGLPSIQKTTPPPLRASDPKQVACLQKPGVVLPVEGAPLVFSTGFAHDLVLHLNYPAEAKTDAKAGTAETRDIPLSADAFRGGLVLAKIPKRHALSMPAASATTDAAQSSSATASSTPTPTDQQDASSVGDAVLATAELTGTVRGFWGFDAFSGPTMPLEETPGKDWKLAGDDPVIAGRNQHIVIGSSGTACIQSITLEPAPADKAKQTWKEADKPNQVDVMLDVPAHDAGAMHLAILQFGETKPATVSLVSYSPPAKLDALSFHAGDTTALLTGTSLDQVRTVELGGVTFKPSQQGTNPVAQADGKAELRLSLVPGAKFRKTAVGDSMTAKISLSDGRTLPLAVTIAAPRPSVALISKADVPPQSTPTSTFDIRLASQDDLPVSDTLMFSLKSARPFPRAGKIEVASEDDSLHATFSLSDPNPSLILESPETLLANLQPLKAFGPSAFGPIRARAVAPDGSTGDWLPLVTLVRLPTLTRLSCPVITAAAVVPATHSRAAKLAGATAATAAAAVPVAAVADQPAAVAPAPDAATGAVPVSVAASPSTQSAPTGEASTTAATSAPQAATCTLFGNSLYFIDSIATDEAFTNPTRVPEGFVGSSIDVQPPTGAAYYLRLRDDPATIDTVTLPAGPL